MKKNLLTSALAALVLLAAVSCKKNSSDSIVEPSKAVSSKLLDDPNFISMSLAKVAAVKTGQMMHGGSAKKGALKTQAASSQQIVLADSLAYPNDATPSFYIFNYQGGGFVIIGADKRSTPIQAYNSTGTFKLNGEVAPASVEWLKGDHARIQDLRKDDDAKPTKDIAGSWSVLTAGRSSVIGLKIQKEAPPEPPCEDYQYSVEVAPLITTQWGQGEPYNYACPSDLGGRAMTGCVATAMAQILYYWKKPNTYNWAAMPQVNGNYNAMAWMFYDAGLSVNMSYSSSGSGAAAEKIAPAFKNTFGYSSADLQNYDYWDLRSNLYYHVPVLALGADGQGNKHAWVCDGFMELTYWYCGTSSYPGFGGTSSVLHMNWGWSGQNDGYFLAYDWGQYTYQKKMVWNIVP